MIRLALLFVLTVVVLSLVVAIASRGTGPIEKVVLALAVLGLIVAAAPVRRIGTPRA